MLDDDAVADEDDDEDDELDRLLLPLLLLLLLLVLLVLELDRFRFDLLSIDDELKRMWLGCQEEFIIRQYSHPFTDDFCRFGDLENRLSFEDLFENKLITGKFNSI